MTDTVSALRLLVNMVTDSRQPISIEHLLILDIVFKKPECTLIDVKNSLGRSENTLKDRLCHMSTKGTSRKRPLKLLLARESYEPYKTVRYCLSKKGKDIHKAIFK